MPCYVKDEGTRGKIFLRGELGQHCADCSWVGDTLCDYPVGHDKTCDRVMCEDHGIEVAPDVHYCAAHYAEWCAFRDSGGVSERLQNVIAFKHEKRP